jgi:hypothetical protein
VVFLINEVHKFVFCHYILTGVFYSISANLERPERLTVITDLWCAHRTVSVLMICINAVSIVAVLSAGLSMIRIPTGTRKLSHPKCQAQLWGFTEPPFQWEPEMPFPRVKMPGHEADCCPVLWLIMRCDCIFTRIYAFMACIWRTLLLLCKFILGSVSSSSVCYSTWQLESDLLHRCCDLVLSS